MKSFQRFSQYELGVRVRAYSGVLGAVLALAVAALPYLLDLPGNAFTPFVSLALAASAGYLFAQALSLLKYLNK